MLVYCRRLSPGRHRFVCHGPLDLSGIEGYEPETGNYTDEALREALTRMNDEIEKVVRTDPNQWLWGHKRWRTRPPGEPPLY